jgi:putative addiction module component (TIGR02574 family)
MGVARSGVAAGGEKRENLGETRKSDLIASGEEEPEGLRMTRAAVDLLAEALRLPEAERGELAIKLIESLDPPEAEGEVDEAWGAEIQQRVEELRSGQVKPLSWSEARRLIMDDTDEPTIP